MIYDKIALMQAYMTKLLTLKEKSLYYHEKYEAYLPAFFFISGFLLDILTLGEIDDLSNIIIQGIYLILGAVILAWEYTDKIEIQNENKVLSFLFKYREDIFHFLLGALLSAFTLFYFKSSSFVNSFSFLFILSALLILNELSMFQKIGVIIRSSLFMLCLISYFIYLIPIIAGEASTLIFFLSSFVALLSSIVGFYLLSKHNSDFVRSSKILLAPQLAVISLFVLFYLLKVFPPIPLSIKSIGIYHDLEKKDGTYITKQLNPWWKFWQSSDTDFEYRDGDKVFVFTKIFSPAGFAGKIYLHWLKEIDGDYLTSDKIPLAITGGRSEGFRGYAYKNNYSDGNWQIRVETDNGLEIGRVNFSISKDTTQEEREFKTVIR